MSTTKTTLVKVFYGMSKVFLKLMLYDCRKKYALGKDALYSDFHYDIRCSHWTTYILTVVANENVKEFFSSTIDTVAKEEIKDFANDTCIKCDQVTNILNCFFQEKFPLSYIKPNVYIWKTKFTSYK